MNCGEVSARQLAKKPRKLKWGWKVAGFFLGGFVILSFFDPSGPLGCTYYIASLFPPHSRYEHGTTPQEFEGISVQMDAEDYSTAGFALHPDGRASLRGGMQRFRWHYDNERLFIDSWTMCGSCWQGTNVREYKVSFDTVDRLVLTPQHDRSSGFANPMGNFERITVTDKLKEELGSTVEENKYEAETADWYPSQYVLSVIEMSEAMGYDYSEPSD